MSAVKDDARITRVWGDRTESSGTCYFCDRQYRGCYFVNVKVPWWGSYSQTVCPRCFEQKRAASIKGFVSSTLPFDQVYKIKKVFREDGSEEFTVKDPKVIRGQQETAE